MKEDIFFFPAAPHIHIYKDYFLRIVQPSIHFKTGICRYACLRIIEVNIIFHISRKNANFAAKITTLEEKGEPCEIVSLIK